MKNPTHLQSPTLMMQVVKPGPVTINQPERIPRKDITAMIADCLDRRQRAKKHALAWGKSRDLAGEDEAEDVEEKSFEPVSVDGTVGVGDVEAVVLGVDETCGKWGVGG